MRVIRRDPGGSRRPLTPRGHAGRWGPRGIGLSLALASCVACGGNGAVDSPPVELFSCPEQWRSARTVVAGDAQAPICVEGTWVFDAPARNDAPSVRRSEVFLADVAPQGIATAGSTVVFDSRITAVLGPSGTQDRAWHVVWQLQGPTQGEWRPPPVGLQIRDGRVYLGGGAGHPDHDWNRRNYEWRVDLGPFADDVTRRIRVEVTLSPDVDRGVVSAWFDGTQILDHWKPVSPEGYHPGTLYPGQDAVAARIGLYRGSQGESPPDYRQTVTQRVLESSVR